jgi:hypothetical protein
MRAYAYDEQGLYTGSRELREDVLNGGYLPMAANETADAPPDTSERQVARYLNGTWSVIPDHRGITYYDTATREQHTILEAGVEPESGWTDKEPPAELYYTYNDTSGAWVFDLALYREQVVRRLSDESFARSEAIFPEYKARNIERGVCTYDEPYTLANKVATDQACRAEFYRVKSLIEAAQTQEEIDAVIPVWPTEVVTS